MSRRFEERKFAARDLQPRRIAVLRALALGDLLCAVPALRAIRAAWPAAEIALIGLPWAREFTARFGQYVDRFIEFPGYPGLPEREPLIGEIPGFLAEMQRERFDLAIQLHGSGTIVNEVVALLGAQRTAGFFPQSYYCPNRATFVEWPEHGLEVQRLLALPRALGLPDCGEELELPLDASDFVAAAKLEPKCLSGERYVVIHPGASTPARRWPAERFAYIADQLADRGMQVVLTGVASEAALVNLIAESIQHRVTNLVGATNLGTLGALVARAALVVANDTGISHVAAALRTPSVIISTANNPARWAPVDCRRHRVLCSASGVSADEVLRAAEQQLALFSEASTSQTLGDPAFNAQPTLATA
jgi:ADP-heptose:LPS heptosyltransferase